MVDPKLPEPGRRARTGHLRNGTAWDPDGGAGLTSTAAPPSSHGTPRPTRERLDCSWNCRSCPDGGPGLPTNRRTFLLGTVYVVEVQCGRGTRVPMLGGSKPLVLLADVAHAVEPPGIRHLQHRGSMAVHVPKMNRQRRRRCRRWLVTAEPSTTLQIQKEARCWPSRYKR